MKQLLQFAAVLEAFALACQEFPSEPPMPVTIAASWPREMFVRDSDTLGLTVTLRNAPGTGVTGLRTVWQSSDVAVLQVAAVSPSKDASRKDSLTVQLRAVAKASAPGRVVVSVAVAESSGLARSEFQDTITVMERWVSVTAGGSHSCALTIGGTAYCWGTGTSGQIGNGSSAGSLIPVRVFAPSGVSFSYATAGDAHTCGAVSAGVLYCWGNNGSGALGTGTRLNVFIPVPVASGQTFLSAAAGAGFTCAISDQKYGFCWGIDQVGQVGDNSVPGAGGPCGAAFCKLTPVEVTFGIVGGTYAYPQFLSLTASASGAHACGVDVTGSVDCWGWNAFGQLGVGSKPLGTCTVAGLSFPCSVSAIPITSVVSLGGVSAGGDHTCAVTASGDAYCWGKNASGELGAPTSETCVVDLGSGPVSYPCSRSPIRVSTSTKFSSVGAGSTHTCGLTPSGVAYCWGANDRGQLGDSTFTPRTIPVPVSGGHAFSSLSVGVGHACGVISRGAAYCWGRNDSGQLGNGAQADSPYPVRVSEHQ